MKIKIVLTDGQECVTEVQNSKDFLDFGLKFAKSDHKFVVTRNIIFRREDIKNIILVEEEKKTKTVSEYLQELSSNLASYTDAEKQRIAAQLAGTK